MPSAPWNISVLSNFENSLGVKFTSVKWYQDWDTNFDLGAAQNIKNHGAIPELTWQPQVGGSGVPDTQFYSGAYDSYINTFADTVKQLGSTVRISLAPEMNTDWTPWGVYQNGNTNETHKAFWRYVVQRFRDRGATNARWIWSPNIQPWNKKYSYAALYPGDAYVDFVGLDGYNWGTSQSWSQWQSFREVFDSSYFELIGITSRNVLIMETASAEVGGNKAQWITDMYNDLQTRYTRIQGVTWFNINKETDWRIESSSASKQAYINGALLLPSPPSSASTATNSKPKTSTSNRNPSTQTSSSTEETKPIVRKVVKKTSTVSTAQRRLIFLRRLSLQLGEFHEQIQAQQSIAAVNYQPIVVLGSVSTAETITPNNELEKVSLPEEYYAGEKRNPWTIPILVLGGFILIVVGVRMLRRQQAR